VPSAWCRSEDGEYQQPTRSSVPDAVWDAFGRDEEISGFHRQFTPIEQEHSFALEHVIDLVLPGMSVERVLLARLECVEADQQTRRFEEGRLSHLLRGIDRVVSRPNDRWMLHS